MALLFVGLYALSTQQLSQFYKLFSVTTFLLRGHIFFIFPTFAVNLIEQENASKYVPTATENMKICCSDLKDTVFVVSNTVFP